MGAPKSLEATIRGQGQGQSFHFIVSSQHIDKWQIEEACKQIKLENWMPKDAHDSDY